MKYRFVGAHYRNPCSVNARSQKSVKLRMVYVLSSRDRLWLEQEAYDAVEINILLRLKTLSKLKKDSGRRTKSVCTWVWHINYCLFIYVAPSGEVLMELSALAT